MRIMKGYWFVFLFIGLLLSSCSDDCNCPTDEVSDLELADSLSTVLIDLINTKSGGVAHFTMPDHGDYASIPQDPRNPITAEKVKLGMMLYHDPATGTLAKNEYSYQTYSCATCHPAEGEYQPGIAQGIGEGGWGFGVSGESRIMDPRIPVEDLDVISVKVPSALNFAFEENTMWNAGVGSGGMNEGTEELWDEFPYSLNKLGYDGIETQVMAASKIHRFNIDPAWVFEYGYKAYFDTAFYDIEEKYRYTNENACLAIAAYERTVMTSRAPFQEFLKGNFAAMTESQKNGAVLFFGKASCVRCHTGTAFGNPDDCMAIGLNDMDETNGVLTTPQTGRYEFTGNEDDFCKFKVPQLYNLKGVGYYGHGSSMTGLRAMIDYTVKGEPQNDNVPDHILSSNFTDQDLSKTELDYIDDFIRNALYDPEVKRHTPDYVPSGFCFPNADSKSLTDLGCN